MFNKIGKVAKLMCDDEFEKCRYSGKMRYQGLVGILYKVFFIADWVYLIWIIIRK